MQVFEMMGWTIGLEPVTDPVAQQQGITISATLSR